jgi:hypothetical protein
MSMTRNPTSFESSAARDARGRHVLLVCGLAALLAIGCKQETYCEELGDCGGPFPFGAWTLGASPTETFGSCSEDLYIPPTDKRLVETRIPAAREQSPEPAFTDWCGGLIASADNVLASGPQFYTESSPIGAMTVRYNAADGTYSAGFGLTGTYALTFSAACMHQFGATDGKPAPGPGGADPDPGAPPVNVCKQLEVPLRESGTGEGAYRNTTCDPNPDEPKGCICYFDRAEVFASSGTFRVLSGNQILHMPFFPNFPSKVTYCNKGSSLQLTAADGSYLFGYPGLRTLNLGALNCEDGLQGVGEDGPDCGFACNNSCPAAP